MIGKSRSLRWVPSLALIALVLVGCESFPRPASDEDTAFAVPVVYLDAQAESARAATIGYKLTLENVQTKQRKFVLIDSSDPYKIVTHWESGEYLLKEYTTTGFSQNRTRPLKITQYLKLEKGKVSIFPCKLVIVLVKSQTIGYTSNISVDFLELTDQDRARIGEFLAGRYKAFSRWKS